MMTKLETTWETILSTDPSALTQGTAQDATALTLAFFGQDVCKSCNGMGQSTTHTSNIKNNNERTSEWSSDWSQFTDKSKQPPGSVEKPWRGNW